MVSNVLNSVTNQRILLSPLNWGLGHVTRTIPVIAQLLKQNNEVFICCDEPQERFYRNYFPDIWYIPFEGYPFKFGGKGNWVYDLSRQLKSLNEFRKQELQKVHELVASFKPDLILSDQRFGFRNNEVKSIIISHQLNLQLPIYAGLGKYLNQKQLNKFDEIWIPDTEGSVLSGDLSKTRSNKAHYIGCLSRFTDTGIQSVDKELKYLGIVSGPEPYASNLFYELVNKFSQLEELTAIIAPSKMVTGSTRKKGNCTVYANPEKMPMEQLFQTSKTIVSRSGYSTLMDLTVMRNNAILIPTPGQAEQLYLSKFHAHHPKWSFSNSVAELNLNTN